jgi:carboxylesterase type B
LPQQPWQLWREGYSQPGVDVLMGTNTNEAVLFVYSALTFPLPASLLPVGLGLLFNFTNDPSLAKAYPVPPAQKDDARATGSKVATDGLFTCVDRNATLGLLDTSAPPSAGRMYWYRFAHVPSFAKALEYPTVPACWTKVCHAAELPFVWHPFQNYPDTQPASGEALLSLQMVQYWTSFVHTGVPTSPSAEVSTWPQFLPPGNTSAAAGPSTLLFHIVEDGGVTVESDAFQDECQVWNNIGYLFP